MQMFNLSEEQLLGQKILDCPAGACSFTAVASGLGADVTAADIAYYHSIAELEKKGFQDIEHAMIGMEKAKDNFLWNYFKSVDGLRKVRMSALTESVRNMKQSPERYVAAVLPELPFSDNKFDLTLSAHFLFMYADRLDLDFHIRTIKEFMRVTKKEIRIFPMVDLTSKRYEHLEELLACIHNEGWDTEEVKVSYEFQTNANTMLRIHKIMK
ncbi:methyltransferase domain-containing protein [Paenibacillus sediminis]